MWADVRMTGSIADAALRVVPSMFVMCRTVPRGDSCRGKIARVVGLRRVEEDHQRVYCPQS